MALEKINYEVAPEDLVIEETQEQLKSTQEQIMDGLSEEQKAKATPSAIVQDREAQQQNLSVEWISDKEKLQQVQKYFKDMNRLLSSVSTENISYNGYTLSIKSNRWDAWYSTEATLRKWGKEVFIFDLNANMFHEEAGDDYPVNGTMKADWKTLFYHGDENFDHGIYSNHDVLWKAETYKTIIKNMIANYKSKK